ncbi:MAG: hypothetical protein EA400_08825 [Chromatiaceae bacterium]|nr:MAG: hypothetical protein EA400_08825 [Chromatiaceae bacterium]
MPLTAYPHPLRGLRPAGFLIGSRRIDRSGAQSRRGCMAWALLLIVLGAGLVSGCGGLRRDPFGALSVTVAPGQTGYCAISPCQVFLVMPPGDGDYRVTGNRVDFGRYPAGRTVSLGHFYESLAIAIEGAGVPRAFVYIPATPS